MRKIFKSDRKHKKEKDIKKTVDKDIHLNLIGVPIENVNVDKKLEREQKTNYHMYRITIDTSRDQKERKSSMSRAPPQPSSNTTSKSKPLRMARVNIIPSDSSSSGFINEPRSISKSVLRKPTTSTKKTDQPKDNQDVCYTEEQRPPVRIVGRLKTPDDNNGKERRNSTKRKRSKQVEFSDRDGVYGTPEESHTSTEVNNLTYKGADPQVYHLQDESKAPFTGSELKDDLHPNSSNTSLLQEPLALPKQMAQLGDDQGDMAGNKDPVPTGGQSPGSKTGIDHKDEPTTSAPLFKPAYQTGAIRSMPTSGSTAPGSLTTDKSIVQSIPRNGAGYAERDLPNSFKSVPMKPEDDELRYKRMNPEDDKLLYKQMNPEDDKIGYKKMNPDDNKIGYKQMNREDDKLLYKQMNPEDDKIGYKKMNPDDNKIGYKQMNREDDKLLYKQMNPDDDKIGYKQMNPDDDKIRYKRMNPEDDKLLYKQMNPEDDKIGYKNMNPENDKIGYKQMNPEDDKITYKQINLEDDKIEYKHMNPEDDKIGYKQMNPEKDKMGYKQVNPEDHKLGYKQMNPEDDKIAYNQMNPEDDKITYKQINPEDDKIGYKHMNPEDDKIGYKKMNPDDNKIGYKQMNREDDKLLYKQMNPEDDKIGYKQMNPEDDKLLYEQTNVPSKASKRSDERYAEGKPKKILDKEPEKIPSSKKRISDPLPASKPVRFFDRFSKKQPVMVGNKVLHFETQPAFNEEGTDGPDRRTYDSKDPSNPKPRMQDAINGPQGTIGGTKEFGNQASTQSKKYLPKTDEKVMVDAENVPTETNTQRMIPKVFPKRYSKDSTGSKKETLDKQPNHERSTVPQLVTTIPKPSFKSTKSNFILDSAVSKNILPRDEIPKSYERKLGVNENTSYDAIPGVNENVMTDFPSTNNADFEEPLTKHPNSFSLSREGFQYPSAQHQLNRVESRSIEMSHRTYGDFSSAENLSQVPKKGTTDNESDGVPVHDSRYTVSQPKDYPRSDYGYQNNNELDGPNVLAYKILNQTSSTKSRFNKQPIVVLDEDKQARIGKTGVYAYPTYSATPSYRQEDQGAKVLSNNGLKEGKISGDEGIMYMFKSDAKPLNDTVSPKRSVDESFVEVRINQNYTGYNPDYLDPSNITYPSTSNLSTLDLQREKAPLSETLNSKPIFGDGETEAFAVSDIGSHNPFSSITEEANPVDNEFTGKRSAAWSSDMANSAVTKTDSKRSKKGSHPYRQQKAIPVGKGGWILQMSVPTVETIKEEDLDAETSNAPGNLDAPKPLLDKTGKYYEQKPTTEENGLRNKSQVTEEPISYKYSGDDDTLIKKSDVIAYMGDVNSASPFGPTGEEEGLTGNEFAGKEPQTKPKIGAAGSQQRIPRDSEVEDKMERRDLSSDTHNKPNELTTDSSSTESDQPDQKKPQNKEKKISDESQEASRTPSGKRKKSKLKNKNLLTSTKGTQMSPDDNSVTPKKKRKSKTSQDSILEAVYLGKIPNTSLNVFYSPDKENGLLPEDHDYELPDDGRREIKKTDSCRLLTEGPTGIVIFVNKKGENYVSPFEDPGGLSRNNLNRSSFSRPGTEGDNAFQDELDRISSSSRNTPGSSRYDGRSSRRDPSKLSGSSRKTSSSSKYDSVSSGRSRPGDLNRARSKSRKKSRKGKKGLDDQSSLSSKRRKRSPRSKSTFEKEGDLTKVRRKYPCGCVRITKLDRNNELIAEELMSVYCRDGSQCIVRHPELQKNERKVTIEGSFRSKDSHKRSTFPEIDVVSDGIVSRRPIEPRPPKPTMRGAPLTGTLTFKSNKLNGVCNLYLQPRLKDYLRDNLHVLKELLEKDDRHQSKHS